jgi:hypothetical protein
MQLPKQAAENSATSSSTTAGRQRRSSGIPATKPQLLQPGQRKSLLPGQSKLPGAAAGPLKATALPEHKGGDTVERPAVRNVPGMGDTVERPCM